MTTFNNFPVNIWNYNDELYNTDMFRLIQWKHALKLEIKGVKVARKSVYRNICDQLEAPYSFGKENMLNHIETSIKNINEQLGVEQ